MSVNKITELIAIMKEHRLKVLEVSLNNEKYKIELFDNLDTSNTIHTPIKNIPNDKLIKSPMVGTVYRQKHPSLNSEEKVNEKSYFIRKGDVLCIIEAMKTYNEIKAEEDCEIIEICFAEGQLVEYGQTLFKIRE